MGIKSPHQRPLAGLHTPPIPQFSKAGIEHQPIDSLASREESKSLFGLAELDFHGNLTSKI